MFPLCSHPDGRFVPRVVNLKVGVGAHGLRCRPARSPYFYALSGLARTRTKRWYGPDVSTTTGNATEADGPPYPAAQPTAGPAQAALLEVLERLEEVDAAEAAEDAAPSAREPVLTVPVELTPLPEVDQALGTVAILGGVIRGKRARYRLALLKTLQADRSWRWRIGRLQEIVHWLEPQSTTELVADLKAVGVLDYDPLTRYYRLGVEGRLVSALVGAITVPQVERRRLIKAINKTMSLALALGAADDIVVSQFQSAVVQLQEDWDELNALIEDMSRDALLEAAQLVQDHVEDMKELLSEHETFLASRKQDTLYLDLEQEALDLVFRLGGLAASVIQTVSGRADDLMRSGFHVDRGDIRQFISDVGADALATMLKGLVAPPPFVMRLSAELMFDAVDDVAGRKRATPPPLPEPAALERRELPHVQRATDEVAAEARELRLATPLIDFVARDDWAASVERHTTLIDVYSRFSDLPSLAVDEGFDVAKQAGILRLSRADLKPRREAQDEDA
jgi:hypothetical protein